MRMLNGSELAGYIKGRQVKQVRALKQAHGVHPKLAIVVTIDNPVIEIYMRMKKRYGADIGIDVDVYHVAQTDAEATLNKLSNDDDVQAIIVQLPLEDPSQTEAVVNLVPPKKDVDGLGADPDFEPATPLAILWLLSGYNIELGAGKQVVLVGRGKLVGTPLEKMLLASGITPQVVDKDTPDAPGEIRQADVIISATGVAGLIKPDMVKQGAVVVDAGVASEGGKTVGDVAPEVFDRQDLTITPVKGGVGPLTVCALFENVIRAAQRVADKQAVQS